MSTKEEGNSWCCCSSYCSMLCLLTLCVLAKVRGDLELAERREIEGPKWEKKRGRPACSGVVVGGQEELDQGEREDHKALSWVLSKAGRVSRAGIENQSKIGWFMRKPEKSVRTGLIGFQ
jgi:hypothetical protein